jgi:hypothetical protein
MLQVHAFMRVQCLDILFDVSNFCSSQTTLLCLLVMSGCTCCCLHSNSTCNHISESRELHIRQVFDG